jgi:hypothetical protein
VGRNKNFAVLALGAVVLVTGCSSQEEPLTQADRAMHNCTTIVAAMDREFETMQPIDLCNEYRRLWGAKDFDSLWITDTDRLLKNHEVNREDVELYVE